MRHRGDGHESLPPAARYRVPRRRKIPCEQGMFHFRRRKRSDFPIPDKGLAAVRPVSGAANREIDRPEQRASLCGQGMAAMASLRLFAYQSGRTIDLRSRFAVSAGSKPRWTEAPQFAPLRPSEEAAPWIGKTPRRRARRRNQPSSSAGYRTRPSHGTSFPRLLPARFGAPQQVIRRGLETHGRRFARVQTAQSMSELVVVGFDTPQEADRVLDELHRLQREYLVDLRMRSSSSATRKARSS